jgi:Ca-activated chloride channel family protein
MQVALGDVYGDERRRVVAALELVPQPVPGPLHVADLVLRWVSVAGPVAVHTVTLPVTVEVGADPDAVPPNPAVVEQVHLLTAARVREEARRAADEGRYDEAARSLRAAAATLDGIEAAEPQRRELFADAERLDVQDWDAGSSKRLHSTNRTLSKGRRSRYDDSSDS